MGEVDVVCVCDVVVAVCGSPEGGHDDEVPVQAFDVLLACAAPAPASRERRMNRPSLRRPQPTQLHSLIPANRDYVLPGHT